MFNLNKSHEGEANSAGRRGRQGKEKIQDVRGAAECLNSNFTNDELKNIFNQIFSDPNSRGFFFELLKSWREKEKKRIELFGEIWLESKLFNSSHPEESIHQAVPQIENEHPERLTKDGN